MINKINLRFKTFLQSEFFKNVSILTLGSITGQIILITISPILTRIYTPENFGNLSIFTSVCVIVGVFVTGKYEHAIILPKEDEEGINILALGSLLSLGSGILLFLILIVYFFGSTREIFPKIQFFWIYSIPITSIFAGLNTCLVYWLVRKEKYREQSIYNFTQAVSISFFNLLLGLIGFTRLGLELSYTLALIASFITLIFLVKKTTLSFMQIRSTTLKDIIKVGKRYSNFPKFYIWSQLLSTIIQHITPIIFASIYSTTLVGLFSLANRIIRLPIIIISNSISAQETSEKFLKNICDYKTEKFSFSEGVKLKLEIPCLWKKFPTPDSEQQTKFNYAYGITRKKSF